MDLKKGQDDYSIRKAVIIADTFTNLLNPMKDEISEVLLPVCNIPILEYMIDFLTSNSIKEIIICAKNNTKTLDSYLKKHHKRNKGLIKLITSDSGEDFSDMGDCLRKISAEKLISNDFILIRGLVITNIDLEKAFNFHLKKKEQDPNRIITSIMKTYKNDVDVRTKYDENIIVYDKNSNRILQYESTQETRKIKINENVKFKVKNIPGGKGQTEQVAANYFKVRSDLYDTFIDICTPDIFNIFSENFDYQSIRDHIYKNVIVSDVYADTFYLYEASADDYVGVIRNVESYFKVSNEIINRWSHPVVLEHVSTPPSLEINIKATNLNIYLDSEIRVDPKSNLTGSVVLAQGVLIEEGVELSSTVIGKNSQINSSSKLKNSIVYSNCQIGENVTVLNSVIGNRCIIDSDLTVYNCYIGDDVHITSNETGNRIYISKDEDEETEHTLVKVDKETFLINLEDRDLMFVRQEEKEEDDLEEDEYEDDASEEEEEEEENYQEEVESIIKIGIEKENKYEDIVQEISSLKNAFFEKTFSETVKACFSVIFKDFHEKVLKRSQFQKSHIPQLKFLLINWKGIFSRFVPNESEQINFLSVLEELCIENPYFIDVFHIIVQLLNSDDFSVLPDDIIREWANKVDSSYPTSEEEKYISEEFHKLFVEKMKKFLEQI